MDPNLEVDTGNEHIETGSEERTEPTERLSIRDNLKKAFEDGRRDDTKREDTKRDETGRFQRTRKETTEQPEIEVKPDDGTGDVVSEDKSAEVVAQPPAAWAKEAKETWAQLPPQAQQAILKREQDVEKGVNELKAKVASYTDIDKALQPHIESIRKFNKTPAQAVEQLFAWFQALAVSPDQAFPALIKSYNYDPQKLMAAFGIKPEVKTEAKPEEVVEGSVPPAVQSYISKLEEKINGLQNQVGQQLNGITSQFAEQSAAKTQEVLVNWAKDKPHFEKVRVFMGHLLTPDPTTGVAAVPLKDGRVDLDTAYDMAINASPEIRAVLRAEEQAKAEAARKAKATAEAKAQQDQANKSRKAAQSITTGAPGVEVSKKGAVKKGKSVRESLAEAIEEARS